MLKSSLIWDNLAKILKMHFEALMILQRLLIKSNMISRILGRSGPQKVVPLTTKFSQAKISDSIKLLQDLTTTKSSMDRV